MAKWRILHVSLRWCAQNVDMSLDLIKKDSFAKFMNVGFMLFITGDIFARGRVLQMLSLQVQKMVKKNSL